MLENIEKTLDRKRRRLGASSCTFYVRDPYWTDEFRLVFMPGVKIQEPMHGFTFSPPAREVIADGESAIFCDFAQRGRNRRKSVPGTIPSGVRRLFRDFAEREGVVAYARRMHAPKGDVEAVLFVNFAEKQNFDENESLKGRLYRLS